MCVHFHSCIRQDWYGPLAYGIRTKAAWCRPWWIAKCEIGGKCSPQHISVLQNGTAACCLRDETRHEPLRRNTVQKRPEPRNRPSSLPPQYTHCTKNKIYGDKTQILFEVLDICINSRSATPNFGFSRAFSFIYHCPLYRQNHVEFMVV